MTTVVSGSPIIQNGKVNRYTYTLDVPVQIANGTVMLPARFISKYLGYDVEWIDASRTVALKKQRLFSTIPTTEAEKAVIARARQLTSFTFTPLKDIYAGANGSTYYGMVCNALVRYALGIEQRHSTRYWLEVSGIKVVANKGEFKAEDIKLCDILHAYGEGSNHVAIVTDILRNESGEIVKIEVSEEIKPTAARRSWYVDDFYKKWEKYKLCRYEYLDSVPPFDEEQDKILFESGIDNQLPMIAVDYGNKSNYVDGGYYFGNETVISVFAEDTEHFTEFCVCKPEITHTVKGGIITIKASSQDPESVISHVDFRDAGEVVSSLTKMIYLTDEEKESGVIVREIPEGAENFKVNFRNKYGIWTHKMITIESK